ncbi:MULTISPECIES: Asp-tRNA(Asn)/Glu-tRNA(Gln) amidotransferase subunit GatA [Deinococcus]|uniref:Glutamyl-tRNA(Gln) amidotransferase subunit A n=1 Tax=Deinococcus geothermalis (strain DSM 11300 / CIP 105573 / AG-3a) TaxID=319795 RepID=GATA_DEIGD|nr:MULTISPECIES: Asp-tRNA(Asn)/Glu-tRNA(Gln) amidotransferase subunit GatA [Deinococcus]Q1J0C2.1 RecName: Full=Glutamyl-tRNA(Gln) amidotransferase subunit A; Short=Glu-ADT subunit A [Deinococcus geothermalis DSM 11300]ABF45062.1 glutamyl-tRNA(Gln) amidotransferase, A subunit [Deinococcus geothermalis DSM 11300]MBI0445973.1 Asp-tRNA(Asn)/Glu-tRNA(Gln) amidotransferase subunit GatA [Deinococcus sp. DB0503]TDE87559.1 Asp-tRNA(Asn)/Glu-tRNA(Gln) amidotransferase subunit GatA [Deinococcus sp. S9]
MSECSTATDLARAVQARETTPQALLEAARRRAEAARDLNALISLNDRADEQAARVQVRLDAGETLPLAGVPIVVKDNLNVIGTRTTCGSRILANYVSPYDATAVERLTGAGAVIIGKANMDEFAMGSSTESSAWGPTLNPWDRERVPGGSSGGSAVAVAANLTPVALGSDTGGSVRQPAAFTGIYGLKPTYGRVSRYGLVAYASSLDQIGPFARSAADLALLMNVLAGHDPRDATSLDAPPAFRPGTPDDLQGLRVGVIREALEGNTPGVEAALNATLDALRGAGATVREVSVPSVQHAIAAYYLIATPEASSNLARYDGMVYGERVSAPDAVSSMTLTREQGFGREVKRRIMLGTYALSSGYYDAYYSKAMKVRRLIAQDFARAFGNVDVLVTPTSPFPAFRRGEKTQDPLAMYAADVDTVAINLAGLPALSVPAGFERVDGVRLPVGVQLIAPPLQDERLVALAGGLEGIGAVRMEVAPAS